MTEKQTPPPSLKCRPAIVMPTHNNAGTLAGVIDRARALAVPIIVVNDGSTDHTAMLLRHNSEMSDRQRVHVVTHSANRGKAAALQSGFAFARTLGCTHAVSIDTDGQLDPEDIPRLLQIARAKPRAFILGCRDDQSADYPVLSRLGRRLSNMAIRLETGIAVDDSQCGLRVYPLEMVNRVSCRAGRYGFEAEVITKAAWAGFEMTSVPVHCRYFPSRQRVSHFRPCRDSVHGVCLHLRLLLIALLPFRRRCANQATSLAKSHVEPKHTWRHFMGWISPRSLWRQVRGDRAGRTSAATGFAVGVFMANLPIYPLQTLTSLYVARRWHLHPLPVVAGSQISTPPINVVLIFAAIHVGHFLLTGQWLTLDAALREDQSVLEFAQRRLAEWVVGGAVIGVALGLAAFLLMFTLLQLVSPKSPPRALDTPASAEIHPIA